MQIKLLINKKNIIMKVIVEMSFPGIRSIGKEKKSGFPQVASFTFSVDDDNCPFCGRQLHDAKCDCKKFATALKKLQDSIGDKKHASYVKTSGLAWGSSFFDVAYEKANKARLPYDLFDDAFRTKDTITGEVYFVSRGECEDGKTVVFYLKTLADKKVYKVTAVMRGEEKMDYPTVTLVVSKQRFTDMVPGIYGSSLPFWEEEIIKTFTYQEFLTALRQLK